MHDAYAYLEDLNAPATRQFAAGAHAETLARFCSGGDFDRLAEDITRQLQDERQIPFCQEHRARMYHFYQSADYPKGVYRVCSAASYRAGMPDWQVLFSVADFDEILDDDVYLEGVSHYVEAPQQVLITLSSAGADAAYTLEFNLNEGALVAGGFHFPPGKNHIAWRDADSVWVCPAWDERQLTRSGYPREVWLLRRGQSFEEALPVYQMASDGVMVNAWRYLDAQGAPIDLIEAADGFFSKDYLYVSPAGEAGRLNLPRDCEVVGYLAGQLMLQLRSDWVRANQCYPAGALVAVKLNKGDIGAAQVLFVPNETQALESVETTKRFVVAAILDNVSGRLKAWRFSDGLWQEAEIPALPQGALELADQPWGGDVVYIAASDFTTPLTLFALDLNVMELTVLRRQPKQFDSDGIKVQQLHAVSSDGINIPYYHVGRSTAPDTPTLVYAYGGFGMPELPHYLGTVGRHWLAQGNAFVLANVRGGGEFGPRWHHAAQGSDKYKSVDDLLAVVRDLAARGLSSPKHIGLQGGSNGGLITAAAFAREPHNIGALVCEVPLTDMLNYTQLSAGASWIEEYGDPENPAERESLAALSPYHRLSDGLNYPPALITTSFSDDRVHPAHALKFYAKLRANGQQCWLYAPGGGGHTGNGTQAQTAAELACVLRFLHNQLQ
ncbi:prolyl oligopeptidase family serine peptidase [Uruburuella testudinis]|uniref:Prolyl oligopeptidase family serine peptidase n=1 Tax=Uruburuella testudinis TaxID=1282863 RepID=A0ABY4DRI6_9NEIS|nr:prolyl oligopeptidase family serine peptidase [Uruburuella testudinis]UOO81506.1 prolyl oligopeptidase family serine peptidase [Uruburuella testudinis]